MFQISCGNTGGVMFALLQQSDDVLLTLTRQPFEDRSMFIAASAG
jgi:hypothetical protein